MKKFFSSEPTGASMSSPGRTSNSPRSPRSTLPPLSPRSPLSQLGASSQSLSGSPRPLPVALIFGVGPGLGEALARKWSKEGYRVALCSRTEETLQNVKQAVEEDIGGEVFTTTADCAEPEQVFQAVEIVREHFSATISVLIYNAGPSFSSWPPPGALNISPETFSRALAVGATGALVAAQAVLPDMLQKGHGTILLTGATASVRGSKNFLTLAAPKFALRAIGQSLAREFSQGGVHVCHIIVDGAILSPRARELLPDRPLDSFLSPSAIAETYWNIHKQPRECWTQELDVRPHTEQW